MKTALIVEDLPDARAWLGDIIKLVFPDVAVTLAGTLERARVVCNEAIGSGGFDLALIDLHLPDGSGLDLIREIVKDSPETDCVVATIYDDDAHIFPALQAGARGYLLKDNEKSQLVESLRGIIAGNPPLSPKIARRLLRHFHEPQTGEEVQLTGRETEVLTLAAKGLSAREIGASLGVSRHTVGTHLKTIYRKLNVSSRAEVAVEATRRGLV